jgi:hypothetical protein
MCGMIFFCLKKCGGQDQKGKHACHDPDISG